MAELCERAMEFTNEELDLAQLFKAYGVDWTPGVGQYVLDQSNLIECESPFQDRVFFILDLKHFLRRSETIEHLKASMCWLPTWEQMRQLLRDHGVSDKSVCQHLAETDAIANGCERVELYRLFEECLTGGLGL